MKTTKQPNLQKIVQSLMEIGLSQRKIADETGLTQPTISHIYHGVWGTKKPQFATAQAILSLAEKRGVRADGSKDSKVHPKRYPAKPPQESHNKVLANP